MTAAAAAAAGVFPNWVLLEQYVFRRDDDESFPDDTKAPIRASGTTSWGADFRIAFGLTDPPYISRLYAKLPGFPGPCEEDPLDMVATHRHLALLSVSAQVPDEAPDEDPDFVQDFFIFKVDEKNPSSSSLRALPHCTQLRYDYRGDGRRNRTPSNADPRPLHEVSSGLWCRDRGDEFVVAELTICVPTYGRRRIEAFADICSLRSSFTDDQLSRRKWETMRLPILSTTDDDLWRFSRWQTDAAIPFQRWLCWVDYHQGILFWDVAAATVSFLWFPPDRYSRTSTVTPCSGNGGVSVIDHGRLLKFVYVARHDGGPFYGALKPGTGFTITCHTLVLAGGSSMAWKEDYTVTSDDLPVRFRGGLPMFPRVDIDRPQVVHLLFIEFVGKAYEKISVLSIDMNKKTVVSFYLYIDGNEPPETEDKDFIESCLSPTPIPFLTCEFPRFCYLSRKRKDME